MSRTTKKTTITVIKDTYEFYLDDLCVTPNGLGYINELNPRDAQDFDSMTDQLNPENNLYLTQILLCIYSDLFKQNLSTTKRIPFQHDNQNVVVSVKYDNGYIVIIKVINTIQEGDT